MTKLHVGCGMDKKPGWVNIDGDAQYRPDVVHDLRKPLPYPNEAVDFVYAQHFLEHLERHDGVRFLAECRRVLRPGGVLRISMPDLNEFVRLYCVASLQPQAQRAALNTWKQAGWVPGTPAQMMNQEFRMWGHQFIYDWEETALVFGEAGFTAMRRVPWGESDHADLRGVDTRPREWNDIHAEATK